MVLQFPKGIIATLGAVLVFTSATVPLYADQYQMSVRISGDKLDKSITHLSVNCVVFSGPDQTGAKIGSGPGTVAQSLVKVTNGRAALQSKSIVINTSQPAASWRCFVRPHPVDAQFSLSSPKRELKVDNGSVLVTSGNIN